jgi:hypothetical protein
MRRVSPLTYVAGVGEQITIRIIQSTGIAQLVNYSIGGTSNPGSVPKNAPCIFPVTQPVLVGQTAFFTDASGGSYTTQVSGDAGGDPPDHVAFQRAGTEAFHTLIYTFLTNTDFANLGPDLAALPNVPADTDTDSAPAAKKPRGAKPRSKKGGRNK